MKKEPLFNKACFFILGWVNNFGYCVMLSAAKDLLNGRAPASTVLLCDVLPAFLIKIVAPLFTGKVPLQVQAVVVAVLAFFGFILATFADVSIATALTGVAFHSLSSGLGEITYLAHSASFSTSSVSMWSSGTGFAGVTGCGLYMLLVDVCGGSDKTVLYGFSVLPVLMLEAYFLSSSERSPGQDPVDLQLETKAAVPTALEKLKSLKAIWIYLFSLILVYISEYTINQGVNAVIDFPDSTFYGKYYTFSQFAYQIGVFIARSSLGLFKLPGKLVVLTSLLQFCLLVIFSFEAVYLFLNSFWAMLCLVFVEGLFGGIVYLSAMYQISILSTFEYRAYRLGIASLFNSTGILIASPIGMVLEPWLNSIKKW